MSFRDKRAEVNAILKDGVSHLENCGLTRKKIAAEIGYKDSGMIDQLMRRDDVILGSLQLLDFMALCSKHHFHGVNERGLPAGYCVTPTPKDTHEPNGCVRDEVVYSVEATGAASVEFGMRKWAAVRKHGERLILAGWGLIREAEFAELAPNAKRADPRSWLKSTGDGTSHAHTADVHHA